MPGKRFELQDIILMMYMFFPSLSDYYQAWLPSSFPTPGVVGGGTFVSPKSPERLRFVALKSGWIQWNVPFRCFGNQEIIFFQEL